MSIDADTGLQIDPDENIPRLDVSGVADVIGYTDFDNFNMPIGSGLFDESGNVNLDFISSLTNDPAIFNAFTEFDPEAAAELRRLVGGGGNTRSFGGGQSGIATLNLGNVGGASTAGRDEVELAGPNYGDPNKILEQIDIDDSSADAASGVYDPNDQSAAETARLQRQANLTASGQNAVANIGPQGDTGVQSQSADKTGLAKFIDDAKKGFKDLTGLDAGDAAKYAAMLAMAKMAYNDAQEARKEARGWSAPGGYSKQAVRSPGGGVSFKKAAMGGGIGSLDMARGGRALPPRYLDGHSDGMADKVPANIDGRRPAALSDGEFVIPADVVSHLGNGNSNAGAKRLYKMMDDIRAARTGNHKQGKQINPDKFMPR